jgi:hypothetical protein
VGERFRKSIRLAKGVSLNLGKKGTSLSVHGHGLTTTISERGVTETYSGREKAPPAPNSNVFTGRFLRGR